MSNINVLLVDDHVVIREALANLLNENEEISVVAQANNIQKALHDVRVFPIDVAIVDLSLGQQNGLDLVRSITEIYPLVKCLVFSMYPEALYAERSLRAGAKGYVMKSESPDVLISAIKKVYADEIALSRLMTKALISSHSSEIFAPVTTSFSLQSLGDRELEILLLVGKGNLTKEIAQRLNLSVKTVDAVRQKLKVKLGLGSASDLVKFAIEYANSINT
ncbi:response regulator transcription factor [Shewanella yunxiaonensis]|uniref:Response regulator transcription factor n=1 Tax=Shewanella yunxiaonensis TaxID=2829809 RepID=A0ABX7YWC3_9GAMM|nr:response regulator transcription factor [Shewanella yunxiaonensis]QUN06982.1 response regulator transcription factor [Shewanella yunxiaonensis]